MAGPPGQDEAFYRRTRELLEEAYLGAGDPRGGSGFRGDAGRWELARRPVALALDRDGTFLDVGCANGLLMESLAAWGAEDGRRIEPYGLDLVPTLAALARRRLPQWSDRIFTGNVMGWEPPLRFDFVRTELEYVPENRRRATLGRLSKKFLVPAGRLVVTSYGSSRRPEPRAEPVGEILRGWGHDVAGESEAADTNGIVITRVAWTDASSTGSL